MLMQGDMNKVIAQVNKVLEGAFDRITVLEERLEALEAEKVPKKTKKAA